MDEFGDEFCMVEVGMKNSRAGAVGVSKDAGGETPSGVEACSVANRSGVGVEAGRLHPMSKRKKTNSTPTERGLVIFQFNLFNTEFLAGKDLCAKTSAIWTMNDAVRGMIFSEASHALYLGDREAKMKLRALGRCAFGKPMPIFEERSVIQFGDFAHDQMKTFDARCALLAYPAKGLVKDGLHELVFSHIMKGSILRCLRPVYKPHSVHDACASLGDHLSGRCVAAPLNATYPGLALSSHERAHMKTSSLPPSADGFVPAWSCSRRGLPGHPHYCGCRWSLTPPFHSYSLIRTGWRERPVSVALFRQVSSSRRVPRPGCYPTPCSMECGLSSIPSTRNRDRPTDLRQLHHTRERNARQR